MDTSRYGERDNGFSNLDLRARFAFKTATSISFNLGRDRRSFTLPGGDLIEGDITIDVGEGGVCEHVGRLDVHHPCDDFIKVQMIVTLSDKVNQMVEYEALREFVSVVSEALAIPDDETVEASFIHAERWQLYEHAVDRDEFTDRI